MQIIQVTEHELLTFEKEATSCIVWKDVHAVFPYCDEFLFFFSCLVSDKVTLDLTSFICVFPVSRIFACK